MIPTDSEVIPTANLEVIPHRQEMTPANLEVIPHHSEMTPANLEVIPAAQK